MFNHDENYEGEILEDNYDEDGALYEDTLATIVKKSLEESEVDFMLEKLMFEMEWEGKVNIPDIKVEDFSKTVAVAIADTHRAKVYFRCLNALEIEYANGNIFTLEIKKRNRNNGHQSEAS